MVHVHLYLPDVLVRELAKLQVEEHETAQEPVVEHEVYLEVVLLVGEALLPAHEGVSAPQLKEELLQVVDDARLQVALRIARLLLESEKLQHVGILDRVDGGLHDLAAHGQASHAVLVTTEREALVQVAVELPLQLPHAPAVPRRLDLVEVPLACIFDAHESEVV